MREEPMQGDAVEIRTMAAFGIAVVISQAALAIEPAASAHATDNWIAVANSPSREALDWNNNVNRQAAETMALRLCAVLQKANNCRILTSGPNCVVAWNADQPLNRPYAAAADTPATALNAAITAAGAFANDPTVRCSYSPQQPPSGVPPGGFNIKWFER